MPSLHSLGQSAGAKSVGLHMMMNRGNPDSPFRAAFMQSGSPIPVHHAWTTILRFAGCGDGVLWLNGHIAMFARGTT
ncbi:hypothetical protein JVU11DRAFT_11467 [Chiua virens]|nr:hypothetical protein JVU11DRAFT_11467 [Chiua virens]